MEWSNWWQAKAPRGRCRPILDDLRAQLLGRFSSVSTKKGGFCAVKVHALPSQECAAMLVQTARAGTTCEIDEVMWDYFVDLPSLRYLGRGLIHPGPWERP
jgi:hypothetical protein